MAKKKENNVVTRGHVTLCFLSDGNVNFYTEHIKDRKEIAERLVKICKLLAKHPELAYHAAGVCEEAKSN